MKLPVSPSLGRLNFSEKEPYSLVVKSKVLILDEATSALDNNTEKQVMKEIKNLGKNITIIMIAHRLSTIRECNSIILLEKGELKGQGTFEELIEINDDFKTAAKDL